MKQRPKFREDGKPNFVSLLVEKCEQLIGGKASFENGYQIEFRLNGVDVPFNEALEVLENEAYSAVEERAQELAAAGMEQLFQQLGNVMEDIDQAFDAAKVELRKISTGKAVIELDEKIPKEDFIRMAKRVQQPSD